MRKSIDICAGDASSHLNRIVEGVHGLDFYSPIAIQLPALPSILHFLPPQKKNL